MRGNGASEHDIQVALFRWWELWTRQKPHLRPLLFAIPNGGARNAVTGARLKAEGVRAGVPDLCLAVPIRPFSGLWLELKKEGGRVSQAQEQMIAALNMAGYLAVIAYGFDGAKGIIEAYLDGRYSRTRLDREISPAEYELRMEDVFQ